MAERLGPGPEFDLIRRILGSAPPASVAGVRLGPGDDCAVVTGEGITLSTDMSVEGVHFRRDWLEPEEIGWRSATAALSDLAAMAARPIGLLASLALPAEDAGDYAVRLMNGVREAVATLGGALLGGDTTRSPGPLVIDITAVGDARSPVLRSGARAGDEIWVTGELGGSALAVHQWMQGVDPEPSVRARYARPQARTGAARWLRERIQLTSLIDISDGLCGDLAHIAAASEVAILLEPARIPIAAVVREAVDDAAQALSLATSGGEDYEICFTASPGVTENLQAEFEGEMDLALTRIGRVEAGSGVFWLGAQGSREPVTSRGYQHFSEGS